MRSLALLIGYFLVTALAPCRAQSPNGPLIEKGSEWAYVEDGVTAPPTWKARDFDDGLWKRGKGPLGYGDTHFTTTLSYGEDAGNKPLAALFRHSFDVADLETIAGLRVEMMHDDGIIVHLNGTQLVRVHMPTGFVDMETRAQHRSRTDEAGYESLEVTADLLREGSNVLAVQVHQTSSKSSDLGFDLALHALRGVGDSGALSPSVQLGEIVRITDLQAIAVASIADWKTTSIALGERAISDYARGKVGLAGKRLYQGKAAAAFAQAGQGLASAMKKFLLDQTSSAQDFFETLSGRDQHVAVFGILNDLYAVDPAVLRKYLHLGMAIALVYDQRPSSQWPHGQVSSRALPRRLPDPKEAFAFWVEADTAGKTLHALDKLALSELIHVVDTPAPFEELRWAQETLRPNLKSISNLYSGIRYDYERYEAQRFNWEGSTYSLADILAQGGICTDQAYFTITVAKALGVPAIQVTGEGRDGRHAWVGYLEKPGQWNFETGRYPESKFVTGYTFNPQTWEQLTDHEMVFVQEGFQNAPGSRLARVHALFGRGFVQMGKHESAIEAAREAIKLEPRTAGAWETLIEASQAVGVAAVQIETYCRNAAVAFRRYPDLEASFLRILISQLKSQGQDSKANDVRKQLIQSNRTARPDLALEDAAEDMQFAMQHESIDVQSRLYKSHISRFRKAGMITGYKIVEPYIRHLIREGQKDEAKAMIKYASSRLDVGLEEPLERLLQALEDRL